jgi:hypothetical protein
LNGLHTVNLIAGDTMDLVIHQLDGLAGGGFDGVALPSVDDLVAR